MSYLYDNLETNGWQVSALCERTNQWNGQVCCCSVSYSHCKEEVVCNVQQNISMIVCMFLSLSHCALDIFTNGKCINQGVKYRVEFCANFPFYGTEKAIKLAKNEIKKFEENLNETVKHCLKYNVYKLFTVNVLYDLLLIVSGVKRSVIGGNVNWDLKMKSTTERCLLVCAK